ncbi:MAG: GNAT family N-acetyltransferase [Pleomorphochaeta sp.]
MDRFVNENYSFRFATINDMDLIIDFITKLAKSKDKMHKLDLNEETLKYWIFDRHLANVFFLINDNKEVGFALYSFNFSIFKGKGSIFLEDIYILKDYRNQGYGKIMLQKLCQIAKRNKLNKIEWTCPKNNEECVKFFKSIGAREINKKRIFRLEDQNLEALML